jgi:antitoxin CptB
MGAPPQPPAIDPAADPEELGKLHWRCRRGMKELDLMLASWLESQFERASDAQRAQFEALLELPDPQIARYLLGRERPEGAELAALIDAIRGGSHIMLRVAGSGNLP